MADKLLEFDLHFDEHLKRYNNCYSYYLECLDASKHSLRDFDFAARFYFKVRQDFVDYVRSLINQG